MTHHLAALSDSAMSETLMVTARDRHFMGSSDNVLVRLIDTQGLSDGGCNGHRDIEHVQQIVTFIRQEAHIDSPFVNLRISMKITKKIS